MKIIGFTSMMKNFTKILLGLIASAMAISANAMEWRTVSYEDFGGNSTSDPAICTASPHDDDADKEGGFYTPLNFTGIINPTPGNYMVIKSTAEENSWGDKLTDCGNQGACWEEFTDHTYSGDKTLGYFMVFDAIDNGPAVDINNNLILYKKSLKANCSNVQFRFTAYMASASKWGGNTVRLSIQDENGNDITDPINDDLSASSIAPGTWKKMETEFKIKESDASKKIYFVVMATAVSSSGYDLALDDIKIEVNQPSLTITADEFYYQKPAQLKVEYLQSEFDSFFGSSYSDVMYKWYKYNESTSSYEEIASDNYDTGKDISYNIDAFEKDKHNGKYRIIISTKDNFGNRLCSIQDEFVINQDKDKILVVMCKDSTKVMPDGTVLSTKTNNDQLIETPSVDYFIKCIPYVILDTEYIPQCLNTQYPTAGDIKIDDYIEIDQETGCPATIQPRYIRVEAGNVKDDPKHLCKGDKYITDNNVEKYYNDVDENPTTPITFDSDGCSHEQYVFVHPNKEEDVDVTVCKGDSYDGVPYNKVGTYKGTAIKLKTIWGCDSIITPTIEVVEPVEVTKSATVCPSDNYEFAGKVYNYPVDTIIVEKIKGGASNGCDSTTTLHLIVNDGGEINLDTLICREQILFGDSFMTAGTYKKRISGFTESGCPMDTVWTINVVEITLRLRLFNNQDQVCEGQPSSMDVRLNAYEPNGKILSPTYYWEPEVPSNELSPILYLNETTTYTIYADLDLPSDIDKNAKGCHAKESVTIHVNPLPELSVDSVNPEDRSVEYTVTGGTMPYQIFLGSKDLGILESNTDKKDHLPFGTHILQVQDSTGCAAEQKIEIKAIEPEPDMFFTPNGDGENDRWKIKNLNAYKNANSATVRIFDRYGKMIFSANGSEFESGWDGTYNGVKMPATDYWYEIDIDDIDKQYFGHFTLIR